MTSQTKSARIVLISALARRFENAFRITHHALEGRSRVEPIVLYRHAFMHALYHVAGENTPRIGVLLDGRHHTAVLHGLKRIRNLRKRRRSTLTETELEVLDVLADLEVNPPQV